MRNSFLPFLFVFLLVSCSSGNGTSQSWDWGDGNNGGNSDSGDGGSTTETNPDIVKLGWTNVNSTFGILPTYINVYKSPSILQSKNAMAYIAVADMSKAVFGVWGDVAYNSDAQGWGGTKAYTPSEVYNLNNASVIINGGLFFWDNTSLSSGFYYSMNMLVKDGKMLAPNQNYYSEDWKTFWYPTVGVFYQALDNTFKTTWTYYTTGGNNYCYDTPADNDISKTPLQVPSATFPSTAKVFEAENAIGGVSVLLHNGVVKNTFVQEMFDISAATDQPRTAVGYMSNSKRLVFFVCEGRQVTSGVAGLTTANVADVLKALGCDEAINLDGGGSTCMLINGKQTITPSDWNTDKTKHVQRSVLTGCYLK